MPGLRQNEAPPLEWRRTKIVATLGPASHTRQTIERLLRSGVNVVRLNLSHGDHESHARLVRAVRQAAEDVGQHVAILMDLCGPKIRVGRLQNGPVELPANSDVVITTRAVVGRAGVIPSQYRNLHKDVQPGERIFLDDGHMELLVRDVKDRDIHCHVTHGGMLHANKGMNLPDTSLSVTAFTRKDREDAAFAAEQGADFLALSFVRSGDEVRTVQRYLKKLGSDIPVIAKIEKPEALDNIETIVKQAYGIMIARGDLGIELPAEKVPLIQRDLIQLSRRYSKPVIVATQMLESMTEHARPTRAEVGDVATAALAGTDAVMLSGETANGKHPLRAVMTMDRILREMENYQWHQQQFAEQTEQTGDESTGQRRAIARAVTSLARQLKLQGIIIPTSSGLTAQTIAAARPTSLCLGVSTNAVICRRLTLHWGIVPVLTDKQTTHNWRTLSEQIARSHKLTRKGNDILLVSGFNDDPMLNEPVMKLLRLQD